MDPGANTEPVAGYTTRQERWTIQGYSFELNWPADMDALLDRPATLRRFAKDEYMPYWAQPWPAAVLLAECVLREAPGEAREAVEIGCGVGLVSVVAASRGWRVTACDYDADALRFVELNASRNGLTLQTRLADFREPPAAPGFDCVLAADLVYERRNCAPLARWIAAALRPGGVAMVSDSNRSAGDRFPEFAASEGLATQVQAVRTIGPAGLEISGRIWRVTAAGAAARQTAQPKE